MTIKFLKDLIKTQKWVFIVVYGIVNLFLFGSSYFYNKIPPLNAILFTNIIASVLMSFLLNISLIKKLIFIITASLVSSFIGFVLIFLTMFIPGSKEHNYVMYQICWPAMKKYYGIGPNEGFPPGEADKNGLSKWWYQHSECEQNVWAGKGPIFSETPPSFIPLEK